MKHTILLTEAQAEELARKTEPKCENCKNHRLVTIGKVSEMKCQECCRPSEDVFYKNFEQKPITLVFEKGQFETRPLRALVACEESQRVCIALRELGVEAYSCDILPCSGGHPEWHIQDDVLKHLNDGWDLMIAHPPCTYLSRAGACRMYQKGEVNKERYEKMLQARGFFLRLLNANIPFIAVENPLPLKICDLPKESQVIQPYQFGHPFSKRTHLWLKGLPHLESTCILTEYTPYLPSNTGGKKRNQKAVTKGVIRNPIESSKTFKGIAEAMAKQWVRHIRGEGYILPKVGDVLNLTCPECGGKGRERIHRKYLYEGYEDRLCEVCKGKGGWKLKVLEKVDLVKIGSECGLPFYEEFGRDGRKFLLDNLKHIRQIQDSEDGEYFLVEGEICQ